jgi:hypothetical protein
LLKVSPNVPAIPSHPPANGTTTPDLNQAFVGLHFAPCKSPPETGLSRSVEPRKQRCLSFKLDMKTSRGTWILGGQDHIRVEGQGESRYIGVYELPGAMEGVPVESRRKRGVLPRWSNPDIPATISFQGCFILIRSKWSVPRLNRDAYDLGLACVSDGVRANIRTLMRSHSHPCLRHFRQHDTWPSGGLRVPTRS